MKKYVSMSFGFWKQCNSSDECLQVDFKQESIFVITRSIYYVGYTFQIIATVLNLAIFIISVLMDKWAHNWNLYIIFCSSSLALFTLGLNILIINMCLFVAKSRRAPVSEHNYEITFKSTSLFACFASVFLSQITIGLIFFSLNLNSSNSRHYRASEELITDSTQTLDYKSNGSTGTTGMAAMVTNCKVGLGKASLNMIGSLTGRLNNRKISEDNFRIVGRPTFPNSPPPPAPPLSPQAKQSLGCLNEKANIGRNYTPKP